MATTEHKYLSDWARKYYDEGEAKGEAIGEARGEAKGKASALLQILSARGLEISDDARVTVLACQDLAQLDAWLARALTATSVAEAITRE
jgi:predicted transposase YdaD